MADSRIIDLPAVASVNDTQSMALDEATFPTGRATTLELANYVLTKFSFSIAPNSIVISDGAGNLAADAKYTYFPATNITQLGGDATVTGGSTNNLFMSLSTGLDINESTKYLALNSKNTDMDFATNFVDIMNEGCIFSGGAKNVLSNCFSTTFSNATRVNADRCISSTISGADRCSIVCDSSTISNVANSTLDVHSMTVSNCGGSVIFSKNSINKIGSLSNLNNSFIAVNFQDIQFRSVNGAIFGNNNLSVGTNSLSQTGYRATGTARKEVRLATLNALDFTNHNNSNLFISFAPGVDSAEEATFVFPANFDNSTTTIELDIYYVPTDGNAGNVNFRAGLVFAKAGGIVISASLAPPSPVRVFPAGEAITAVSGTANALAVATVSLDVDFSAVPYVIEPYDYILCRVQRAGSQAADTYLNSVNMYNVGVRGISNKLGKDI
jgi:hypothetical protein